MIMQKKHLTIFENRKIDVAKVMDIQIYTYNSVLYL